MIMNKSKNTYLIYFIMKYNIILFYIELCYIEISISPYIYNSNQSIVITFW